MIEDTGEQNFSDERVHNNKRRNTPAIEITRQGRQPRKTEEQKRCFKVVEEEEPFKVY